MRLPHNVDIVKRVGNHAVLQMSAAHVADIFWPRDPKIFRANVVVLVIQDAATRRADDCASLDVAARVLATAWGFPTVEDMLAELWDRGKRNQRNILLLNEYLRKEVPGMR